MWQGTTTTNRTLKTKYKRCKYERFIYGSNVDYFILDGIYG